ncbi:MAG: HD domain-containing phosphohydrolase [Pseudomonadota bacterium]
MNERAVPRGIEAEEDARTREALLFMLEDLEEQRRAIEQAKREWIDVVDAIRDPLFIHDRDFRIVRANRAYAARAGLPFSELIGKPYWQAFPKSSGALPGCQRVVSGAKHEEEEEFALPTGEIFVSRSVAVPSADATAPLFLHVMQDVTEHRIAAERKLRAVRRAAEYSLALAAVASSDALAAGEVERLASDITEMAALAAGVERANVWLFNEAETELRCIDLYEASAGKHSAGAVLTEAQFASEFDALKHSPYVDADDPRTDPRTAGYVEAYLKPLGITAMLDVVVTLSGKHVGVLCLEHVGKAHHWERDEIDFACRLADKIALAITNRERRRVQEKLRDIVEHSTNLFYSHTPEHRLTYVSPQTRQFLDCEPEDALVNWTDFLAENPVNEHGLRATERAIETGQPQPAYELELVGRRGRRIWVQVNEAPVVRDGRTVSVVGSLTDITERKRTEQALQRANRGLRTLSAGNEALVRATDEQALLDEMCRVIVEVGGYRNAIVAYARDDADKSVTLEASSGMAADDLPQLHWSWADSERGQTTIGAAIRTGEVQIVRDIAAHRGFAPWRALTARLGLASIIGLPLRVQDTETPFGALSIGATDAEAFDIEEVKLLSELAGDLAFGVATLRARAERLIAAEKLRRGLESTVEAIAATVETRDPYTAGHQRRVGQLATAIAREMELPEETVTGIHFGALIHDLGKVQVPAEILAKPARLNKIEFELIKTHAQAGYDIVKGIDFPWPVAAMVHQHHERLDGSGYPQGLKGEEIALEARILAVADVVEAMSSHRPYRPGLGIDAALKEIERKMGVGFEAAAVEACLRLFREKGYALPA